MCHKNKVKEATKAHFIFAQSNRIAELVKEKYGVNPEYLWDKFPDYGIFRNPSSDKWFGIIMNIDKSKMVTGETGEIEVLDVKVDDEVPELLRLKGIYPSYHLSKENWVGIILDDTLPDDEIMKLIATSYVNTEKKD